MFVFTRRAMQQMLDAITPWMPEKSLAELVGRLNRPRTNRLPQMWELALLHGLGSVVEVEHERPLPNGKPDLWFSVPDGDRSVPFVGDVTTLSDTALDAANAFERLSEAVHEQARKAGMQGGGFHVAVSHLEPGASGTSKVQLLIPTGPAFDQLVKRHIKPFARKVSASPSEPHLLQVDEPGAKFTVEYKGPSPYSGGSHRSYDSVLSRENNALFNRLNDKTKQLRGAPDGGIRILVVCDGDCALLGRANPMEGFSARKIAESFLCGSQTIDLVLVMTVFEESGLDWHRRDRRKLHWDLIAAPKAARPAHLTDSVFEAARRVFGEAIAKLPQPAMMPNNALRRNLDSDWSASMEGGYEAGGERIKVSARAVLELLAGAQTYEQFAAAHGWDEGRFNMFKARLASGQLFKSASVESLGPGRDDDWLEFEFGPPDPAISPFRLPMRAGEGSPAGPSVQMSASGRGWHSSPAD